jgi:stage IV sporulation protein A
MDALEPEHPVKSQLHNALLQLGEGMFTVGNAVCILPRLKEVDTITDVSLRRVDLATGSVDCALGFPETLYYEILSSQAGIEIQNEAQLIRLLSELSQAKQEYDKISDALSSAKATGYGVVMPHQEEMTLEPPELLRKGTTFGVKLKASAPSIHMVRVDIDTEIHPMVGDERQSQDLIRRLTEDDTEQLWQSNIFGKSVYELIQDGLQAKLIGMPEDVRSKLRGSLTRIVNEGANGLICLIL